jgi:peptidoglycan/xylan/chitin deacetylase (PgdA/CDA1 family)
MNMKLYKMRYTAKNLIFKALNKVSPLINRFVNSWASILMYHSIGYNNVFFTVRPEEFKWQMNYLKENKFNVVWIDEIIEYLKDDRDIPQRTVALTFDDGYQDFYNNAFPVLESLRFKSTVFLPTDYIGREMINSSKISLPLLNWKQIRDLHKNGLVKFGPHGIKHVHLTELDSNGIVYEINESRRLIKEHLGEVCNVFCYPRGKYNLKVMHKLACYDFTAAVTVERGIVNHSANVLTLKRNSIDSSTTRAQFIGKLNYSVELFDRLSRK